MHVNISLNWGLIDVERVVTIVSSLTNCHCAQQNDPFLSILQRKPSWPPVVLLWAVPQGGEEAAYWLSPSNLLQIGSLASDDIENACWPYLKKKNLFYFFSRRLLLWFQMFKHHFWGVCTSAEYLVEIWAKQHNVTFPPCAAVCFFSVRKLWTSAGCEVTVSELQE